MKKGSCWPDNVSGLDGYSEFKPTVWAAHSARLVATHNGIMVVTLFS